ncbi:MAG: RNA-binding S4 domain-containing protein [Spirochaetota bacterium]|jgi:ribosome-associated protein|nr:RNA-binding S4 domain-containing protein [Spirochaetota bacterium]
METFRFSGDHIELNRLLKASGLYDTGGRAKLAIEEGLVSVNGIVEYRKRCKIRDGQIVACDDRRIRAVGPASGPSES